jgi:hypothetical protein
VSSPSSDTPAPHGEQPTEPPTTSARVTTVRDRAEGRAGRRRHHARKAPWSRWAREFVVIAAGALAALAGQAWWQGRQDRDRERDYLQHLLADTRENAQRIDRLITDDSSSQQTVRRVASFLYDAGPPPPRDTLVTWFLDGGFFSSSAFYPITDTYTALLATGDLRLVRDEALRSELVAYAARMDAEREGMGRYMQLVIGDGSRIVRTFPFMRRLFSADSALMRADARAFDFAQLRRDPEVTLFLFALENAKFNRLNHLRTLRRETSHLRERLEAMHVEVGPRSK